MVGGGEGDRVGGSGAGVAGGGGQQFVDRSKVRILLCDSDPTSSQEVLRLLCNCSYQVTCAKSPRQVINALNCGGGEIDIIMAEVDLPVSKCFKMLKYIARNKELRHIPIIMMSNRDEVSVVVKCLRLGAAEYLVKPLRVNELLNLWTHVWRRRRMLGLSEKNFFNDNFELALSDPSDANTNSTTLLSDDTDDRPRENTNQEISTMNHRGYELNSSVIEPKQKDMLEGLPDPTDEASPGGMFSRPIKTNLRIAESSAFLAYVKTSTPITSSVDSELQRDGNQLGSFDHRGNFAESSAFISYVKSTTPTTKSFDSEPHRDGNRLGSSGHQGNLSSTTGRSGTGTDENIQDKETFEMPVQYPVVCFSSSNLHLEQSFEGQNDTSGTPPVYHYPFYYPGMIEHGMTLHSVQNFQGSINTAQLQTSPTLTPQYNTYPQCHGVSMMPPFQYNPAGVNMQSSNLSRQNVWPSVSCTPMPEQTCSRSERRAAALAKFRRKRNERCFDKKVRYVNRKKLAETRPRVRGQFVSQANYADITSTGDDNSEDEDDDPSSRDVEMVSSPE